MSNELEKIIESSYRLFDRYKVELPLDVCTACCITKAQESDLVNLSTRHIPFELLYDYNTAAKPAKPNIDEFRHFLPRFLEFTSELKFLHHSAELVLYRFQYYDKYEWSEEEQKLLQDFGLEFFRHCLTTYPLPQLEKIDSILIMLDKAKLDVEPILMDWVSKSNPQSTLHFNELLNWGFNHGKPYKNNPYKLSSSFGSEELSLKIIKWLELETTKKAFASRIEELIVKPPAETEQRVLEELSWTYERLIAEKLF